MERIFSEDEANSLLPRLTELLTQLQGAHTEFQSVGRTAQRRVASNGAAPSAPESQASGGYTRLLEEVNDLGVVVRDPESGLVDFPAMRNENPVYLCWRLGEAAVGFWHPRDTGFAGRRPL